MKKTLTIIKISCALSVALVIGIWFGNNTNITDKQVEAGQFTVEQNTSHSEVVSNVKPINTSPHEELETSPKEVVTSAKEVKPAAPEDEKRPFSKEIVYESAILFEAPIYWAIADNDVLVDYNSIEQLVTEFYAEFANLDLARNFAYAFFYEEGNQVRLMPGQLPNLFESDKDFEMNQVTENEYQVKQAHRGTDDSIIYLVYYFKYDDGKNNWKIESIQYE